MNKRKKGFEGEKIASDFLIALNYKILETNFYTKAGEIDIIALEGQEIIFVEVKYRNSNLFGEPEESISSSKIRHICRTARIYIAQKNLYEDFSFRFDVISIKGSKINHIKSAFDYI